MAEVADVHKLPQQLATLLDEVVVIAGRHARLHLYPDTGNRYRSENMAFLNSSQSRRAPVRCSPFAFEPVDQYIERFSFLQDVYCFSSDYPPYEGGKDPIGAVAKKIGRLGPDVFEKFFVSNAEWVMPN